MFSSWGFRASRLEIEEHTKVVTHYNHGMLSFSLRRLRQWRCNRRTRKVCFMPNNPFAHPQEMYQLSTATPVQSTQLTRSELGTPDWGRASETWDSLRNSDNTEDDPVQYTEEELQSRVRPPGLPQMPRPTPREPAPAPVLSWEPPAPAPEPVLSWEPSAPAPTPGHPELQAEQGELQQLRSRVLQLEGLVNARDRDLSRMEAQLRATEAQVSTAAEAPREEPQAPAEAENMEHQRWEFLFAQANGDRMILNEQLDQLQHENDQLKRLNAEFTTVMATAQQKIAELVEHSTQLQSKLDASMEPADAAVLRNAMAALEARHAQLQHTHAAAEAELSQAKHAEDRDKQALREAQHECGEQRALVLRLQQSLSAKQDASTSTTRVKALETRTEAAEDFALKLQTEIERLNMLLGSGPSDQTQLQRNNSFLLKRIGGMEASMRNHDLELAEAKAAVEQQHAERLEEIRSELTARMADRIARCSEQRAREFVVCGQCGSSKVGASNELNALIGVAAMIDSCFDDCCESSPERTTSPEDPSFLIAAAAAPPAPPSDEQGSIGSSQSNGAPKPESFTDRIHRELAARQPVPAVEQPEAPAVVETAPSTEGTTWAPAAIRSAEPKPLGVAVVQTRKKSSGRRRQVDIADAGA